MSYTDKTDVLRFLIDSKARDGANDMTPANLIADDTDVAALIIPANCEVELQNVRGYVFTADADATIEVCLEDNTIQCRVALDQTGHVAAIAAATTSAATFPIRIAPQSTTLPKLLKLRTSAALDTDTKVLIEVSISGLRNR